MCWPWEETESWWGSGVMEESFPAKGTIKCQRSGDQEDKRIRFV